MILTETNQEHLVTSKYSIKAQWSLTKGSDKEVEPGPASLGMSCQPPVKLEKLPSVNFVVSLKNASISNNF